MARVSAAQSLVQVLTPVVKTKPIYDTSSVKVRNCNSSIINCPGINGDLGPSFFLTTSEILVQHVWKSLSLKKNVGRRSFGLHACGISALLVWLFAVVLCLFMFVLLNTFMHSSKFTIVALIQTMQWQSNLNHNIKLSNSIFVNMFKVFH